MRLSKVLTNTIFLLGSQIYTRFAGALFFFIAARFLGVSTFGTYTLILTFLSFFYIFSDWGLSTLTIRDLARSPSDTKDYLIHTIPLRFIIALFSYIILLILVLVLAYPKEIIVLVCIAGLSILTNTAIGSLNAVFSSQEKMHIPAIIGIIFSTTYITTGALALFLNCGLLTLMIIMVFLGVVNVLTTAFILRKILFPFKLSFDLAFYKKLLKESTPYAILSALSIIYFRADTIILSKLTTMTDVGIYNSAYKIVDFLMFLPICYMGAVFPQMSRQNTYSKYQLQQTYWKTTKFLAIFILPVAIIFTIFSKQMITILFGKSFIPASSALQILIWGVVVMYINAPAGNILYSSNKMYKFIPYAILNTFLNIILNFIFIPRWGYIGASITTLITEITGFIWQIWLVKTILFSKEPPTRTTNK
jgi:O-antigen/teichoic acid export membrane protein